MEHIALEYAAELIEQARALGRLGREDEALLRQRAATDAD